MRVKVHIGNAPHDCDEVRRLRRDARLYRKLLRSLSVWLKMTERNLELDLTAAENIDAALAPRRRKKP